MRAIPAARREGVACAKSGVVDPRTFHQSVRLPCGSVSMSTTGPAPGILRGHREVAGERGLARPAFLRRQHDDLHEAVPFPVGRLSGTSRYNSVNDWPPAL